MHKKYGLVSIGSHTGAWLKQELEYYRDERNILVEPVPYNLIELKENTKDQKNIIIEESAISDKNCLLSFYFVKRNSIRKLQKHWASGIGSFEKSHLLNHKNKRFLITDEDIEEIKVNCINFETLKKKYNIAFIDKLMIDVEGAEFKILSSINFKEVQINKIFFEKKHFDGYMKQSKKFETIKQKLEANNYILKDIDKENILAILK